MKYIQPDWPANHVRAYTTVRQTWGRARAERVTAEERIELKNILNLPDDPIWLTQTHSNIVIEARPENCNQIGDASYATEPSRVCMIETADCMPILMCHQKGNIVAAIHAGWRGLAAGIIENTLEALGQPADEMMVWLGPAIGPNHFEVGKDVYDAFTHQDTDAKTAFKPHSNEKWLANLYALARMRLHAKGISQIYGGNFCTFSQDDLFFSYRRDKGITGRMATLIWIVGTPR